MTTFVTSESILSREAVAAPLYGVIDQQANMQENALIRPFRIAVSEAVLSDLKQRLRNTRWPDRELVDDWSQGAPLAWVQDMCHYWCEAYDWRSREAKLNRFDQFLTEIDGLDIHFIHQRSPHAGARPLLITHGWPGSMVEFQKVIEPLVNPTAFGGLPSDAFHVVCPSLPGYSFSGKPSSIGWGVEQIARTWAQLMGRLGYAKYFAQGGDWGSAVTRALGALEFESCSAIHVTLAMGQRPIKEAVPSPEALQAFTKIKHYQDWDSGYSKQQATRPQTLGYGLADSPSGQAAWILEKFWAWTDCRGHPENILHRDELLDNVMLYWISNSATSSARLYWESFGRDRNAMGPVKVPVGVAVYPQEIVPPVRAWLAEDFPDLRHWEVMPRGGHFAAFEQPELYVQNLRTFFGMLPSPA
jgi:epoxide hydrolase